MSSASPDVRSSSITAQIGGRAVERDEVLAWEARRAARVAARLDLVNLPVEVEQQREALVARKLDLGPAGIKRLLARDLRWSARVARAADLLPGHRRLCTIELRGRGLRCELVPDWYQRAMRNGAAADLLAACPDHYHLALDDHGREEIVETAGGAPMAMRVFLDQNDMGSLTTSADPAFPVEWAAVARDAAGVALAGIRHHFRDDERGFHARLTVEFPAGTLPRVVRGHRWHLACEFSNWIEAANR